MGCFPEPAHKSARSCNFQVLGSTRDPTFYGSWQLILIYYENSYFEHKIAIFTGPEAHLKLILYIWIIKIQVLIGLNFHNISILTTRSHKKLDPWWIQKPKNCNFMQIYVPAQEITPYENQLLYIPVIVYLLLISMFLY